MHQRPFFLALVTNVPGLPLTSPAVPFPDSRLIAAAWLSETVTWPPVRPATTRVPSSKARDLHPGGSWTVFSWHLATGILARMWIFSAGIAAILATIWGVIVREQAERKRNVQRIRWNDRHWAGYSAEYQEFQRSKALPPSWEMTTLQLANMVGPRRARNWRQDQVAEATSR